MADPWRAVEEIRHRRAMAGKHFWSDVDIDHCLAALDSYNNRIAYCERMLKQLVATVAVVESPDVDSRSTGT